MKLQCCHAVMLSQAKLEVPEHKRLVKELLHPESSRRYTHILRLRSAALHSHALVMQSAQVLPENGSTDPA